MLRMTAIQAKVSKDDLGWLEAACPALPLEDDDVCADNPDPPEVLTEMVVVLTRMVVVVVLGVVKNVRVMSMVVTIGTLMTAMIVMVTKVPEPPSTTTTTTTTPPPPPVCGQCYVSTVKIHNWQCNNQNLNNAHIIIIVVTKGNFIVEHTEECDCGEDYLQCQVNIIIHQDPRFLRTLAVIRQQYPCTTFLPIIRLAPVQGGCPDADGNADAESTLLMLMLISGIGKISASDPTSFH